MSERRLHLGKRRAAVERVGAREDFTHAGPRLITDRGKVLDAVNDFVLEHVEAVKGARVTFDVPRLCEMAPNQGRRALAPDQFVDPLRKLCEAAEVPTRTAGGKVYLVNVRLSPMAA